MPQNARSKEYLGAEQFGLIVTGLNVLSAVGPFAIAATQYRNQRTGDAFLARMAPDGPIGGRSSMGRPVLSADPGLRRTIARELLASIRVVL